MRKPVEVQEAKELMSEARDWSTLKWMFEKPRVRETADRANDALDRLERSVKARWSDELKAAFNGLSGKSAGSSRQNQKGRKSPVASAEAKLLVLKVKEADDTALWARLDAEKTFDEAERKLSTSLARGGCRKAIHSWDLREKAIRKAEVLIL